MIMVIGSGGGSVAAGSWTFNTVSALPAIVTPSTILAITSTTPGTKYAGKEAPDTPTSGDVWFWIDDPSAGILLSDGVAQFKCYGAYQWDGTAWVLLTSYVAWMGLWVDLPSLPPVGTTLQNCSWEQINLIGRAGKGADYFTIGSTKTVTLTTNETITLVLVGMNHDLLADGSGDYAPFTFNMVNCLQATGQMESSSINTNGWHGCAMRGVCNGTFYGVMPTALKDVIKQVAKKASSGNQSSTIVTSNDYIWLAAEVEIFGATTNAKAGEGTQYAYYTDSSRRIKRISGVVSIWWERSPIGVNASGFCAVSASGAATYYNASESHGVALGLCV
jgi:hypothetical protein